MWMESEYIRDIKSNLEIEKSKPDLGQKKFRKKTPQSHHQRKK